MLFLLCYLTDVKTWLQAIENQSIKIDKMCPNLKKKKLKLTLTKGK